MQDSIRSTGFLLLSVVALAVAPGLALSAPGHSAAGAGGAVDAQSAPPCDYEQLYDETIGSVVLVQTGNGLGSGFVYEVSNGSGTAFVVTNQHVVNETAAVVVKFARGESVSGRVVGTDALSDLAVVRVDRPPAYAESLPLSSERPQPGQPVAALGSPYGLRSTITSGIVSGTNRSIPTQGSYAIPNTVQTDAAINPGNSGGPLVRCPGGEVVGVNRAGGGEDIGFAVPASIVRRVVPTLAQGRDYDHPMLGVQAVEVTPPVARANDLNATDGLLVVRTARGTPASEVLRESQRSATVSGMRVPVGGDVIVGVGNRSVDTPGDLKRFLALEGSPGEPVELTVLRDGDRRTVNVTLVERSEPDDA